MARPDYLIIGAQRAGTTSLYEWLCLHPGIVPAKRKEVRYFSFHYSKGINWYGQALGKRRRGTVHGEAEPNYLFMPEVPQRVKKCVPNVKLIVLLREPAERAWSNYKLMRGKGLESRPPGDAFKREEGHVKKSRHNWLCHSYKGRGRYAEQLKRWLEHFPRKQFFIIHSARLFKSPVSTYAETLRILGLPSFEPKRFKAWNHKGQGGLHPSTRQYLKDYFKPYNQELYELLGVDFGWDR